MSRYQGQWGGGNRGGGGWGGGGGGQGGYSGGGGGGGRGGGRGGQSTSGFKETVRVDRSVAERPKWQLTCYGHQREGPNDISGDISPEEVRWAFMISAERGATMVQLGTELKAAEKAKVEQFQALQKVHRAPSKGGQPIPPPTATISNLEWVESGTHPASSRPGTTSGSGVGVGSSQFGQQPAATSAGAPFGGGAAATASPFGQPGPAFGQHPAGASPFGQPAASGGGGSLGQPMPSIGGASGGAFGAASGGGTVFGSNSTSGGVFGASKPAFGQQAGAPSSAPFGAGATTTGGFGSAFGGCAASSSGTNTGGFGSAPAFNQALGFGQTAPAAAAAAVNSPFNKMSAIAATPTAAPFGSQAQPTQPFGGAFGAKSPSNLPLGAFGNGAAQPLAVEVQQTHQGQGGGAAVAADGTAPIDPCEAAAWEATVFEKGKIPENDPPPVYCR